MRAWALLWVCISVDWVARDVRGGYVVWAAFWAVSTAVWVWMLIVAQRAARERRRSEYVPLFVREGGRRAKGRWWFTVVRERVALKLAPWLTPRGAGR